jgi:hypothetical protein
MHPFPGSSLVLNLCCTFENVLLFLAASLVRCSFAICSIPISLVSSHHNPGATTLHRFEVPACVSIPEHAWKSFSSTMTLPVNTASREQLETLTETRWSSFARATSTSHKSP